MQLQAAAKYGSDIYTNTSLITDQQKSITQIQHSYLQEREHGLRITTANAAVTEVNSGFNGSESYY